MEPPVTEIIMKKRAARAGEIGLFPAAEVWEDDFSAIKIDQDVTAKVTTPKNQKQNALSWVIAGKIAAASDLFDTPTDARDHLLIEARHFRRVYDRIRKTARLEPKPTANLDGTEFLRLLRRMVHVATTQVMPELPDGPFKRELEEILTPDFVTRESEVAAQEPRKPRARKQKEVMPDPTERNSDTAGHNIAQPPTDHHPPALDQSAATAPLGPQNADEYVIACEAWIGRQTDQRAAMSYFESDAQIQKRAELRVSVGQRKMLLRKLAEHFEAKK